MSRIKEFIRDNNISFAVGNRNSSIVCLIGFSQYLELTEQELIDELSEQITNDIFILQEIIRLFEYCKNKNYGNWWNTTTAKSLYKF